MSKGSVAILMHSAAGGGAQAVGRQWANELANYSWDIHLILLDAPSAGGRKALTAISTNLSSNHVIKSRKAAARIIELRQLLLHLRCDYVLCLETYPNLLALCAASALGRKRPEVIISEHNIPSIILRCEGPAKRVQLLLSKILYKKASAVVAVSHPVATDLAVSHRIKPHRLNVILNGVDIPNCDNVSQYAASSHAREAAPDQSLRPFLHLVVPARFADQKRPWMAAKIAEELLGRGYDARVSWIGDGGSSHERSASALIECRQWTDDWAQSLSSSDIVVLPSQYEGLGNVLVEAGRRGVPVVAGSIALGCADAIIPGVTGYLARTDTPQAYADAIERAAKIRGTGNASIERWFDQFRPTCAASEINSLIESISTRS